MDPKSNEKVTITLNDMPKAKKRRRLRIGDPDFTPPDGGWGWLVVFACGFSNLSTFPMSQQFGLIFREKFQILQISQTQTTTIINLASAFNACVGLTNGPLFRRFTYRQVSMAAACCITVSLLACRFCSSFLTYLIFFSICYGCSYGITQSSNALALNTYFKEKRRIATGFSWTTTALGPTIWPYVIVALNQEYGIEGTILLFAGFAMHSFACALLLHPVEWHTKFREDVEEKEKLSPDPLIIKWHSSTNLSRISSKIFSKQGHEDDPHRTGYEISDPVTPMMIRANDGWFSLSKSQRGSRLSLTSNKGYKQPSIPNSDMGSKKASIVNLVEHTKEKEARKKDRITAQGKLAIIEGIAEEELQPLNTINHNCDEKQLLKDAAKKLAALQQDQHDKDKEKDEILQQNEKIHLWQKISLFFDFDLFKDLVYVNIMMGITIANFAEINFSILTPIILAEFNFPQIEIAQFMSLLGITDIILRFTIPFIADKIGWSNRTFFLIGVCSMAAARVVLIQNQSYTVAMIVAVVIGAGKALRTIFMALVIPSHVPLERLPAASGLQLAFSGITFVILGPIVGWIRTIVGNYVITIHLLNICTYFTLICWMVEALIMKSRHFKGSNVK